MCYPSPGPRCSQHAWARLERCRKAVKQAEKTGDSEAVKRARKHADDATKEFFTTPKGHKYLKAKIAETGDPQGKLQKALENGIQTRKDAMVAYKLTNTGKEPQIDPSKTRKSPSPVKLPQLTTNPTVLQNELNALNNSGDRMFIPGTLQISTYNRESLHIRYTSYAIGECIMQVSMKNQSVLAYKDYEDPDEEEITESRPSIVQNFADFNRSQDYGNTSSEIMASNLADVMERLDDPSVNWNRDTHAVSFLYFGEAHGDINMSLRNKTSFNKEAIATLDRVMSKDTLSEEVTVYRGIRDHDGSIRQQIEAGTYRDAGYLSTTTTHKTAKNFSGGGKAKSILMVLNLPAGTKCADLRDGSEAEIALPRNFDLSSAKWEFFS